MLPSRDAFPLGMGALFAVLPVRSQSQYRAELPVLILDVCLRNGDVSHRHLEVGVPEHLLQRKDLATISQEPDGAGVPERMRRASNRFNAGGTSQPPKELL